MLHYLILLTKTVSEKLQRTLQNGNWKIQLQVFFKINIKYSSNIWKKKVCASLLRRLGLLTSDSADGNMGLTYVLAMRVRKRSKTPASLWRLISGHSKGALTALCQTEKKIPRRLLKRTVIRTVLSFPWSLYMTQAENQLKRCWGR